MWPTCITIFYWSLDLSFSDILRCHWSVLTWLWCIEQSYILFWILLESGTAYCLNWKYLTLVWHWDFVLCLRHWEVYSLQVMRTQLETLGEEFRLAGSIWWGEANTLWVLGQQDALALWGQWPYLSILFVWRFVWWDVSVLWGQYLHHRHRALWIGVYHLRGRHRCSFSDFDHRLQEQPYLYATLLYIVDWLLQWSKDYSDTTVFGWPTLWMSNGTFYSTLTFEAARCYLYVESWFGDGTLCSDYV